MSKFSNIVFRAFGLIPPTDGQGVIVPADSDLALRVDGNTDSGRNNRIEAAELFEEVFGHRDQYSSIIGELRRAGLEDPFLITPKIRTYIETLFGRYNPETNSDRAELIYRSVISSEEGGLTTEEGGLDIYYNNNKNHFSRLGIGSLLPRETMQGHVAQCLEYSFLLAVLFRAAGFIETNLVIEPRHAYVLTYLGEGEEYVVDAAKNFFGINNNWFINTITDREAIAGHYAAEGLVFMYQGDYELAEVCFSYAVEIDPNNVLAWLNEGKLLERNSDFVGAMLCYKHIIRLNPNVESAWTAIGNIMLIQGNFMEAMSFFDHAIEIDQNYAEAWRGRGDVFARQGDISNADRCYNRAAEEFTNNGIEFLEMGLFLDALEYFDQAIEISPNYAEAWFNKGIAQVYRGKLGSAIDCFRRVTKINPANADAWNNEGLAFEDMGLFEEAIDCYDHAISIEPQNPEYRANRTVAQMRLAISCNCSAAGAGSSDSWFTSVLQLLPLI